METKLPEAHSTPRRGGLVWIVPLIALFVGGYLVYREVLRSGPRITITFEDAGGVSVERTKLLFKGIVMGEVTDIRLQPGREGVEVDVDLAPSAKSLAREGSRFWIRRPEISFQGVRGLETLLSGASLAVEPGEGPEAFRFTGLERAPLEGRQSATEFVLRTPHRRSLDVGTPVAYRGVAVGRVSEVRLAPDARAVLVRVQVYGPYDRLVRTNSVFWNASGIELDLGLFSGLKLRDGGVESLLKGSLAFATPEKSAPRAPPLAEFELADQADKDWLKWSPAFALGEEASVREAPADPDSPPEPAEAGPRRD
jgi:paraquat-inducible protein B